MLPTPAKFHYVFNLRDLSRIWQGILTICGSECESVKTCFKLWRHECLRVLADRFTTIDDRSWFIERMKKTVEENLPNLKDHYSDEETYFVDFLRDPPEPTGDEPEDFSFDAPKIYEEIPSYETVTDKIHEYMAQYNEAIRGVKMDLVLFRDALVHLIIISRIIRTPR